MVQRGVREEEAELPAARRHRVRDRGAGPPRQQHDRTAGAGQQALGQLVHRAQVPGRGQVGHHHRERLVLAVLGRAQPGRRLLAVRVHRQVIPAEPLDRQHLSLRQHPHRPGQRIIIMPNARSGRLGPAPAGQPGWPRAAGGNGQPEPRATRRAADRLGVEPAVGRVVVLGPARRAHGEAGHRGQRPVVRHVPDDAEPRPAVGAVDERVAEPPVRRVGQLAQAVRAGRGVRRDQRAAAARRVAGHRLAGNNGEPGPAVRRDGLRGHPLHLGQRGCVPGQRGQEILHALGRAPRPPRTRRRRRCRPSQPGPAWWPGSRRTAGSRPPGPHPLPGRTPGPCRSRTQCARFPGRTPGRPRGGRGQCAGVAFSKMRGAVGGAAVAGQGLASETLLSV